MIISGFLLGLVPSLFFILFIYQLFYIFGYLFLLFLFLTRNRNKSFLRLLKVVGIGHLVLLLLTLLFLVLVLTCLGLSFDATQFIMVSSLKLLELFNLLHAFEEKLPFLQDLIPFCLESFILVHHPLSSLLENFIFTLHFLCLSSLVLQPPLGFITFFLKLLPFLNDAQIFFSLFLNFPFVLL